MLFCRINYLLLILLPTNINLYQKRVEDIKLAIADVMKQFSELENMVPSFMENKRVENQQHLEKLALKFKDELQSIEKENEEMLAKLKEKRLEMVAELAEQTGNIISGYNASINEVNSGIYELERTYRVLIKDELQKKFGISSEKIILCKPLYIKEFYA